MDLQCPRSVEDLVGGRLAGCVTLLYGPPASGKTLVAVSAALNAAKHGKVLLATPTPYHILAELLPEDAPLTLLVARVIDPLDHATLAAQEPLHLYDLVILDAVDAPYIEEPSGLLHSAHYLAYTAAAVKQAAEAGTGVLMTARESSANPGRPVGAKYLLPYVDEEVYAVKVEVDVTLLVGEGWKGCVELGKPPLKQVECPHETPLRR